MRLFDLFEKVCCGSREVDCLLFDRMRLFDLFEKVCCGSREVDCCCLIECVC